jgi:hypothetical protein
MQLRHLAEAERHIALGAQHISNQELRIADLDLAIQSWPAPSWEHFASHKPNTSRTAITS